jgi:UDP-N-acetyl-D-mannosaminuronate dehydrogenase
VPHPGPGVGGTCLSKDPYLYANPVADTEFRPVLGVSSRDINAKGHSYVYEKIRRFCEITGKDTNALKILIIGLAFKGMPETSDIRDSMALNLAEILPSRKNIRILDFVVKRGVVESMGYHYVSNVMDGFRDSDAVLVMNNHYQNNKFNVVKAINLLNKPAFFFDGWNMFDQAEIERTEGVYYATMGYMTKRS